MASAEVIATRLALVGPPAAAEVALMVPEKAKAFAASGAAVGRRMGEMAVRGARAMARENAKAAEAAAQMARACTPADLVLAHSRYLTGWLERASSQFAHFAGLAVQTQAEALAPIYRTATANARRLRR